MTAHLLMASVAALVANSLALPADQALATGAVAPLAKVAQ
jgi:hypothetical protein